MRRIFSFLLYIFLPAICISQMKLKSVDELINTKEPGWLLVKNWIDSATNKVEILSCDTIKARRTLYEIQVTTRSPMGAIIYSTGGILVDNGWIRILGSGNIKLKRNIAEWNKGKSFNEPGQLPGFLLIADDAVGGFFAINGGTFGKDLGKVYYMSPDDLKWEPLNLTYSDFLNFCFKGNLKTFYESLRWKDWENDIKTLDNDNVFTFFPYLFTKEAADINKITKGVATAEEQYSFNMEMRKQLGLK